ncbi:MAG: amidohydrolase family protein [Candidatus Methylomirabilia bacterium]
MSHFSKDGLAPFFPEEMSFSSTKTTAVKNTAWVAAWDAKSGTHVYRRDCDIVFTGDTITFVGKNYGGQADDIIDGRDLLVMPGFVNIHSHPSTEPGQKGIREEHGVAAMYMSSLYQRSAVFRLDEAGRQAAAEVAYAEMLASGVTSVADLSVPFDGWVALMAKSGLRGFLAPGYASSRWALQSEHELLFEWDEVGGRRGFETALALIDEASRHPSGRLSGVVYPAQIDTCSEELLRDSMAVALDKGLPITIHVAQSVPEFNVMIRRHGKTPIQWAHETGLLGPNMTLGHAIFIDEHSWLHWSTRRDLSLIAQSGASVAHCPTPFARYGQTLEDFGRYLRGGVNLGIGTDCSPHNIIEEMRTALILARVAGEDIETVRTADLLHAATVGGANALLRDDLGRLAPGCKADMVLVDLRNDGMRPLRDPLRSLIYTAAERAVRDVYIDGAKVVEGGRVLTLDRAAAVERLEAAQRRMMAKVPELDYEGRSAEEISPPVLPIVD